MQLIPALPGLCSDDFKYFYLFTFFYLFYFLLNHIERDEKVKYTSENCKGTPPKSMTKLNRGIKLKGVEV